MNAATQQALDVVLALSMRDYSAFVGRLNTALEDDPQYAEYGALLANVDRAAWHQMMAGAYSCMDTVEMAVGSERCASCGEWHPIPEHWQRKAEDVA